MKAIKQLLMYKDDILADARQNGHFPFLDDVNEAIAELEQLQTKRKELEAFYELVSSLVGSSNSYQDILNKLRS